MKPLGSDAASPERRREGATARENSFAVSSLFRGLRIGKFRPRPESTGPPISRERRRGVVSQLLLVRRDGRRRCIGFLGAWEDLARFQLGFYCFQWFAGGKSSPPSQPAPGRRDAWTAAVALAKPSIRDRARRGMSDRERAARSRGLDDLRQPPSHVRRLGSPAAGSTCGGGISGRAWPRRILVIGGRTKRIA